MRVTPLLLVVAFIAPLVLADAPPAPDPGKTSRRVESIAASVSIRLELIDICVKLGKTADADRIREETRAMVEEQWHLVRDLHLALGGDGEVPPRPVPRPEPPKPTVEEIKLQHLRDYQEGRVAITRTGPILLILRDDKEEDRLRNAAAVAIRERFRQLDRTDRNISGIMVQVAKDLLPDLNHRDEIQRTRVAGIFQSFWPGQYAQIAFDPKGGTYRSRYKKWKEWRTFLAESRK